MVDTHDARNQLVGETSGTDSYVYSYDAGGNLVSVQKNGEVIKSYTYGDASWKDLLTAFNGQSITYDAIGNPLSYRGMTLSWAGGRRLASVSKEGLSASYVYNTDGIRTQKTVNGVTTNYYLDGNSILRQVTGNDVLEFFYDANGVLGFYYNNTPYYYLKNLQGDIVGILDANGTQVVSYTYDAWGAPLSVTGTAADTIGQINPFRYRSYYYDNETGLYYLNSRYYDPETYRFLNADAAIGEIGEIQGTNMFVYAFNSPLIFSDCTGNWPKLSTIFTAVAVVATVVAVAAVCVATAGLASVAVVGGGTMLVATATTTAALGVAATAGKVAIAAIGAATVSKTYENLPRNHTVYGLQDPNTGRIEYVGRTTNPTQRAQAHKKNQARAHLEMVILNTGLNAVEARGVEQIQMLKHHTINTTDKMNNQINGISPSNPKLGMYMEAGRGVVSYLENQISNEILYWTGN